MFVLGQTYMFLDMSLLYITYVFFLPRLSASLALVNMLDTCVLPITLALCSPTVSICIFLA